jgi:hypothetical protein
MRLCIQQVNNQKKQRPVCPPRHTGLARARKTHAALFLPRLMVTDAGPLSEPGLRVLHHRRGHLRLSPPSPRLFHSLVQHNRSIRPFHSIPKSRIPSLTRQLGIKARASRPSFILHRRRIIRLLALQNEKPPPIMRRNTPETHASGRDTTRSVERSCPSDPSPVMA